MSLFWPQNMSLFVGPNPHMQKKSKNDLICEIYLKYQWPHIICKRS
jgi:hypothetical protein